MERLTEREREVLALMARGMCNSEIAGELYASMKDRYYHGRAFVLELMVVIILVIELVYLFRGIR